MFWCAPNSPRRGTAKERQTMALEITVVNVNDTRTNIPNAVDDDGDDGDDIPRFPALSLFGCDASFIVPYA